MAVFWHFRVRFYLQTFSRPVIFDTLFQAEVRRVCNLQIPGKVPLCPLLSTSKVTRGRPRASYAHKRILLNHRPLRMNIFDKPNKHPVCKRRVSEHPQISTAGAALVAVRKQQMQKVRSDYLFVLRMQAATHFSTLSCYTSRIGAHRKTPCLGERT